MAEGMGAWPPNGAEWQAGKTAASIRFVEDAQKFIEETNLTAEQQSALEAAMALIQNGKMVFTDWTTIHEFLYPCC